MRLPADRRVVGEGGLDAELDPGLALAEEEPFRQAGAGRAGVGAGAGHLEDRHVDADLGAGGLVAGGVLRRDADPHRSRDGFEHGIHDEVGVGLAEERDPLLALDLVLLGRAEDLVDEVDERLALAVVGEDGLEAVGIAGRSAHRVAEPGGVRGARADDAQGAREAAEGTESVLGDRHGVSASSRRGRGVTSAG